MIIFNKFIKIWISLSFTFQLNCMNAFNLDVNSSRVYRGKTSSWFGYSVAFRGGDHSMRLLVGAPKANDQSGIANAGAVYKCYNEQASCILMAQFHTGSKFNAKFDDQLLGATLSTSAQSDDVLACAPMYKEFLTKDNRDTVIDEYFPCGRCLLLSNDRISPLNVPRSKNISDNSYLWRANYGFGIMGFSAALTTTPQLEMYVGAPGKNRYHGTIMHINDRGNQKTAPPLEAYDGYQGYATTTGDFNGDGSMETAGSVPRTSLGMGAVIVYDTNLNPMNQIDGTQMGSYFGYSLASADFNGDGQDDLIIGEPMYSKHTNESSGQIRSEYAIGKVTVYLRPLQKSQKIPSESIVLLYGSSQFSQFGTSVANAGDLNKDGYHDLIVGAPFDGDDNAGAVYIFMGSTEPAGKHSQKILASEVDKKLQGFGFSVAGGHDIDNNDYPDVLVGAWHSDSAVFFRSRPVIEMTSKIVFDQEEIDLNEKSCQKDGIQYSCVLLKACLQYTGSGTSVPWQADFHVIFDFDTKQSALGNRFIKSQTKHMFQLRKGSQLCKPMENILKDTIVDKLTPIVITATYQLIPNPDIEIEPILDPSKENTATNQIEILKPCGEDKICIPDLSVAVDKSKDKLVHGSSESLQLVVTVLNKLENAYSSQLFVTFSSNLAFEEYHEQNNNQFVSCREEISGEVGHKLGESVVICDLGNPLPWQKSVALQLQFALQHDDQEDAGDQVELTILANSSNAELQSTVADNIQILTIPIKYETNFFAGGVSLPDTYIYDATKIQRIQFDFDAGPLVIHQFEIRNDGPSGWKKATIDILWPSFTEDGSNLLYIIDEPETEGDISCLVTPQDNINRDSLTVVPRKGEGEDFVRPSVKGINKTEVKSGSSLSVSLSSPNIFSLESFQNLESTASETVCTTNCTKISCSRENVPSGASMVMRVVSRLWLNTLLDYTFTSASIYSVASVSIEPWRIDVPHQKDLAIETTVNLRQTSHVRRPLAWWMYLVAALAGLLLLAIIVLILFKCGFFKRKEVVERQRLQHKATLDEQQEMPQFAEPTTPAFAAIEHNFGQQIQDAQV